MVEIKIYSDPLTLGQFIKFIGEIYSGGEVKLFLENNSVLVNKIKENRRGKKLFSGDIVEINGKKYVLRLENES